MDLKKDQVITLNDGIEYIIMDTTIYNSNKYLIISPVNSEGFNIVKVENKDNNTVLSKLSDEEYQDIILQFSNQIAEE